MNNRKYQEIDHCDACGAAIEFVGDEVECQNCGQIYTEQKIRTTNVKVI
ncbi:MAG: hypothetical protein OIN86_13150 [Candidatus Methanoperedens sp.]|nr:hypothetical protein [Candidatus Methanoperedens sp.]CAG0949168.1 hypothetical protein METP1_00086 [Methanosarcinales archaeon]